MRTLLLLRHAKSDWANDLPDFERPLNARGQQAAQRMGCWMREHHIQPEWIVSSPAQRTLETVAGLRQHLDIPDTLVHYDERLYLASAPTLLEVAARCPTDMDNAMLVAHNPGLDDVLLWLCGPDLPRSRKGKLMTTASLAQIQLPEDWQHLTPGCGKLQQIIRPGEID